MHALPASAPAPQVERALQAARKKAAEAGLAVHFVQQDLLAPLEGPLQVGRCLHARWSLLDRGRVAAFFAAAQPGGLGPLPYSVPASL